MTEGDLQDRKQYTLTPAQAKAKAFVAKFIEDNHGVAPTHREIADGVGMKSPSGAHRVVVMLRDRGHIEVMGGRARAMRVLGDGK